MTGKLRIKNWSKFQHYKDRNPPWIKLHFEMLSSEDWVVLDDASRVLAVACMLVASRDEGFVRVDSKGRRYIKRVAYLNQEPDFKPLIECGFLTDASGNLADASAALADVRPEEETEAEEETEKPLGTSQCDAPKDDPDEYTQEFEQLWQARPRREGQDNKRKAFKAYRARLREGHTHDEILAGVKAYKRHLEADGKAGTKFVQMTSTFLGPDKHFEDDWSAPKDKPQSNMPESARWAQ